MTSSQRLSTPAKAREIAKEAAIYGFPIVDTRGLTVNDDGSFTIPIQRNEPTGPDKANWLPAPSGNFFLVFRFYQPRKELLDGTYPLPRLAKVT
jgi:hypothetical protein